MFLTNHTKNLMNKNKAIMIAAAFPVIAVAIVALIIAFKPSKGMSGSGSDLPDRYFDAPKSFAGNSYSINASVDSQLAYKGGVGRILLVQVSETGALLPLFVPEDTKNFNPMTGQKYRFAVKIDGEGKLVLSNFRKM